MSIEYCCYFAVHVVAVPSFSASYSFRSNGIFVTRFTVTEKEQNTQEENEIILHRLTEQEKNCS